MSTDVMKQEKQEPTTRERTWTYAPKVDIWEDADAYYVQADMPGVDKENVDVAFEEGALRLMGRVESPMPEGYRLAFAEYRPGNYERSFRLAEDVDPEQIEARMNNGVLTLTLPKRETAKPRRIEIQTG